MKNFTLKVVENKGQEKEFLDFPAVLYKDDPNWIRPLDMDVEKVFDPATNKKFRHGEAIRWLLINDSGTTVGRVAAFYDKRAVRTKKIAAGGLGFFDCINDKDAAFTLFDACRNWLDERGLKAMDGPINFGERDSFWGCLVDGFYEPIYNMPYNFPYYKDLFEAYGFRNFFNQYTYHRKVMSDELSDSVREKAKRVFNNPDYTFDIFDPRQKKKMAKVFQHVFNEAWGRFPGVAKISLAHSTALIRKMKPIMDKKLIHIAYYKGEPIGFFIMMPDLYQIFKNFNGKLTLLNKLKLIYALRVQKRVTRIIGRIFGVVPEFQGKGIEGGLIMAFVEYTKKPGFRYVDLEMNWIGDFNPSMMKVCEQISARVYKTHVTYRCLFDKDLPFERASKVNI